MERARQSRYHTGMTKTPKRPRDPNQLAKEIIDLATMDETELAALRKDAQTKKPDEPKRHYTPGKRGSDSSR